MPNKNGTGPEGKGPKTGRGMGTCTASDSAQTEATDSRLRRGARYVRRGLGLGRGRAGN
ncbi:MAG: DUF5320 domain-containing protein [Patescibacteria group bacterium]|nr:DUF5320 domain-containing protein [Patescibacteria group bacterium]